MNPVQKNKFYSPILYDTYGSLESEPILVLEDIFYPCPKLELESLYFGNFKVLHFKRIQWEEFAFEKESLLTSILSRLEELILHQSRPCTILAEGFSSGLALKLALENEAYVSSLHLLSPIFVEDSKLKNGDYLKEFWFWYEKEKEAIRYFYKIPNLLDFFFRNLRLLELGFKIQIQKQLHFWLPVDFPLEKSLKLQTQFPRSEVNRIDKCLKRVNLHNTVFQKILSWKKVSRL